MCIAYGVDGVNFICQPMQSPSHEMRAGGLRPELNLLYTYSSLSAYVMLQSMLTPGSTRLAFSDSALHDEGLNEEDDVFGLFIDIELGTRLSRKSRT